MDLPIDVVPHYIHAILARKGVRVFRKFPDVEEGLQPLRERLAEIFDRSNTDLTT